MSVLYLCITTFYFTLINSKSISVADFYFMRSGEGDSVEIEHMYTLRGIEILNIVLLYSNMFIILQEVEQTPY